MVLYSKANRERESVCVCECACVRETSRNPAHTVYTEKKLFFMSFLQLH